MADNSTTSFASKFTPANAIVVISILCGLIGSFYLSLDKIESHEARITRIENQLIEFRIEYAKQTDSLSE